MIFVEYSAIQFQNVLSSYRRMKRASNANRTQQNAINNAVEFDQPHQIDDQNYTHTQHQKNYGAALR